MKPDYSHWAKKFDKVKHIYAEHGTVCGSVSHCLGNNYATDEMEVCKECLKKLPLEKKIERLSPEDKEMLSKMLSDDFKYLVECYQLYVEVYVEDKQ